MITPLSRGSSFSEDFDDLADDAVSEWPSEIFDPFFSDSQSAVTEISDSSEWTTSKIIEENQSVHEGSIEPLHMDYIIRKLLDDSLPTLDALLDNFISQTANLDQLDEKLDQKLLSEKESSNISCNSEKITSVTKSVSLSNRTRSDPAIRIGNVRPGLRRSLDTKNKQAWMPDEKDNMRPQRGSSFIEK